MSLHTYRVSSSCNHSTKAKNLNILKKAKIKTILKSQLIHHTAIHHLHCNKDKIQIKQTQDL